MTLNNRGSAALEGISVFAMLFAFLAALLLAVYLIFGRVWIQFQAEQALYCLSEEKSRAECQLKLEAKLDHFLPWGEWHVWLGAQGENLNVRIEWNLGKFSLKLAQNLNPETASESKVSPL